MNYDKFTQNVEENVQKNVVETNDGNFSANNMAIYVQQTWQFLTRKKKLSKHMDMGSSFEDLVATDLIVKTFFNWFFYLRYKTF